MPSESDQPVAKGVISELQRMLGNSPALELLLGETARGLSGLLTPGSPLGRFGGDVALSAAQVSDIAEKTLGLKSPLTGLNEFLADLGEAIEDPQQIPDKITAKAPLAAPESLVRRMPTRLGMMDRLVANDREKLQQGEPGHTPDQLTGLPESARALQAVRNALEELENEIVRRKPEAAETREMWLQSSGVEGRRGLWNQLFLNIPRLQGSIAPAAITPSGQTALSQLRGQFHDVISRGEAEQIKELKNIGGKIDGVKKAIEKQSPQQPCWGR